LVGIAVCIEVAFEVGVVFEVAVAVVFDLPPFWRCRFFSLKMDQKKTLSEPQASLFFFPFWVKETGVSAIVGSPFFAYSFLARQKK